LACTSARSEDYDWRRLGAGLHVTGDAVYAASELPPVWFEPWKAMVTSFVPVSGDAADDSDSVFLGDDTSQQTLLTTPQHA